MKFSLARTLVLFPPPLWGRVREGGTPQTLRTVATPTPDPSPQGGGEQGIAF
jgi:hypothetical protein